MNRSLPIQSILGFLAMSVGGCLDESAARAIDAESLARLDLVEQARIGDREDPHAGFSGVGAAAVDENGNLYVVETQAREIRVYSDTGDLLRRIGRPGDGPGEFRVSPAIGIVGDTLWAFETLNRRLTLFLRDGAVLSAKQLEGLQVTLQPEQWGQIFPHRARADGLILGAVRVAGPSPSESATEPTQVPRVVFNLEGTVIDTVGWDHRRPPEATVRPVEVSGIPYYFPRAPAADPLQISLVNGEILLDLPIAESEAGALMRLTRISASQDTAYDVRVSYKPVPYDAAKLDSLASASSQAPHGMIPYIGGRLEPAPVNEAAARAIRAEMNYPAFQPAIGDYWIGADEQVWLRREMSSASPYRWMLLQTDGSILGYIELPRNARILWSAGTTLWVAELDELDIPWLVKYQFATQ